MLKVVSTKYVNEENLKNFLEVAKEMTDNTRKEKGCITYSMNKDTKEENRYAFLEQWENEECLKAHLATDFMKSHVPMLNNLCIKKGDLMIFEEII